MKDHFVPSPSQYAATKYLVPSIQSWFARLPSTILPASWTAHAIKQAYSHTDVLHTSFSFCFWTSIVTFVLGELTGNVSQVDRLWTFLPVVYSAHLALHPLAIETTGLFRTSKWAAVERHVDPRMLLVFILQGLWSCRLTTNSIRRGFFNPRTEDYRWPIVRRSMSPLLFSVFNLLFIAFFQNILLMITALPQYFIYTLTKSKVPIPLHKGDYIVAVLFVLNLALEQWADEQQQAYQKFKQRNKGKALTGKARGAMDRGFVTSGLWGWVRHPNFTCEQANFYILYLFTLTATWSSSTTSAFIEAVKIAATQFDVQPLVDIVKEHGLNYSIIAPLSMTALFISSTIFTESLTAGKYPLYKEYQRRVDMFLWPTTLLKGVWLAVTGQKNHVDKLVYGDAPEEKKITKQKKRQ